MSGWRGRNVRWHGRMSGWRGRNVRWHGRNLRLRQPSYPTYHLHSASPHQQAIPIPAARKGPNGISSCRAAGCPAAQHAGASLPEAHRSTKATAVPAGPRKIPPAARNFTSPPPKAPGQTRRRRRKIPAPARAPSAPSPRTASPPPDPSRSPPHSSQPVQELPAPLQAHPGAFAPSRPSMPPLPQGQQNPRFRQYLSNSISFSYSYCQYMVILFWLSWSR